MDFNVLGYFDITFFITSGKFLSALATLSGRPLFKCGLERGFTHI